MNLSQIIRKARFEVDAIRASGATSALWSDEEVIDAANTAMDHVARILRLSSSDILSKTMTSTDASIDLISETYAPSSFQIAASTLSYTLPPDCVRIDSIVPTTSGYEGVRFYPAKSTQKGWIDQETLTESDMSTVKNSEQIYYYTTIGARTLRISPIPKEAFDVRLTYQYRPPRLLRYNTGTTQLTLGSTTLHGVGTLWMSSGVRGPAELIRGSTTVCDLNIVYPRITTFTAEDTATLAKAWPSESASGIYHISMVPQLPEEHHAWLAQVTAAVMLRKVSPELSKNALEELSAQFALGVSPEVTIRQTQESLPVDEYQLP
mgnify:FL=1